jgi:hypothetical protein
MGAPGTPISGGSASLADLLTAAKNLVTALNNAANAYLSVNGKSSIEAITTPTVVKTTAGRIASVSIITAGSSTGMIYDANALGVTTSPLWIIPESSTSNGEPYVVNLPTDTGILVSPGSGQSVTVSWS